MRQIKQKRWDGEVLINAYQDADLRELRPILDEALRLWQRSWTEQGSRDEGSCTGGKGLRVWYVGKGCRTAEKVTVVSCSWVQGNVSASRSHHAALDYLRQHGIDAEYYDGWMD